MENPEITIEQLNLTLKYQKEDLVIEVGAVGEHTTLIYLSITNIDAAVYTLDIGTAKLCSYLLADIYCDFERVDDKANEIVFLENKRMPTNKYLLSKMRKEGFDKVIFNAIKIILDVKLRVAKSTLIRAKYKNRKGAFKSTPYVKPYKALYYGA